MDESSIRNIENKGESQTKTNLELMDSQIGGNSIMKTKEIIISEDRAVVSLEGRGLWLWRSSLDSRVLLTFRFLDLDGSYVGVYFNIISQHIYTFYVLPALILYFMMKNIYLVNYL